MLPNIIVALSWGKHPCPSFSSKHSVGNDRNLANYCKKKLELLFLQTHRRQKSQARQQFQMRHYLLLKAHGPISKSGIAVMNLQLFQLISAHSGGVLKFHILITWLHGKNWIPVRWNSTLVVWNSICNISKFSRNEIVENRSLRTIQHDLQHTR